MSKLVNTFGACGIGLLLAGCSTTMSGDCMGGVSAGPIQARTFSTKCADNKAATTFINSSRPELQIVGTTMLAQQSPNVRNALQTVAAGGGAPAPIKQNANCEVVGITENKRNNTRTAQLSCN